MWYLRLWEKRLHLSWSPGLHLRLKVHQTKSFLSPEKTCEPVRYVVTTVSALNIHTEHSEINKKLYSLKPELVSNLEEK